MLDKLIKKMTIKEKAEQMNVLGYDFKGDFSIDQENNERLHISPIRAIDGPRGIHLLADKSFAFPVPLLVSATFNKKISYDIYEEIANQMKYYNLTQLYAPGLNLITDPRCGRNAEYYSEDPFLTGEMGIWAVKALEDNNIMATIKHFAVNNFETGRFKNDIKVPLRPFNELYLYAFEKTVKFGNPGSVMISYNLVNGLFPSGNPILLSYLLKWQFKGIVVSDWGANMESTDKAIWSGTHLDMPGWRYYSEEKIKKVLDEKLITMERLNQTILEILESKQKYGLVNNDNNGKINNKNKVYDFENAKKISRAASGQGMVLLENKESFLPLSKKNVKSIAVVGPFGNTEDIIGNNGSSTVYPNSMVTPYQALKNELPGASIDYIKGYDYISYKDAVMKRDIEFESTYYSKNDFLGKIIKKVKTNNLNIELFSSTVSKKEVDTNKDIVFSGNKGIMLTVIHKEIIEKGVSIDFKIMLQDQFIDDKDIFLALTGDKFSLTFSKSMVKFLTLVGIRKKEISLKTQNWIEGCIQINDSELNVYIGKNKILSGKTEKNQEDIMIFVGGSKDSEKGVRCKVEKLTISKLGENNNFEKHIFDIKRDEIANSDKMVILENSDSETCFSACYKGKFKANNTGKYMFYVKGQDGVRMFLDGKKYIDQWGENNIYGQKHFVWISMKKGMEYEIKVEYNALRKNGFLSFSYLEPPNMKDFRKTAMMCQNKDVVLFFSGIKSELFQGESNDMDTFILPGWQDQLINEILKINPNIVVLNASAGGIQMKEWKDKVKSVLQIWYPGQEAGNAICDILFGKISPSGKLPLTFPFDFEDLDKDYKNTDYSDSICSFGYRRYEKRNIKPMYPFGFGLSYTNFKISEVDVKVKEKGIVVDFNIQNTGKMDGSEVVQAYISYVESSIERPVKELKGFEKIHLDKDEIKKAIIFIPFQELMYYDEKLKKFNYEDIKYIVEVGRSADNIIFKK